MANRVAYRSFRQLRWIVDLPCSGNPEIPTQSQTIVHEQPKRAKRTQFPKGPIGYKGFTGNSLR